LLSGPFTLFQSCLVSSIWSLPLLAGVNSWTFTIVRLVLCLNSSYPRPIAWSNTASLPQYDAHSLVWPSHGAFLQHSGGSCFVLLNHTFFSYYFRLKNYLIRWWFRVRTARHLSTLVSPWTIGTYPTFWLNRSRNFAYSNIPSDLRPGALRYEPVSLIDKTSFSPTPTFGAPVHMDFFRS